MPSRGLSLAERERHSSWPPEIARSDLAAYFALTRGDLRWLAGIRAPKQTRLVLAVQRCGLEFLGYLPDVAACPAVVLDSLATQLRTPATVAGYPDGVAARTRREHAATVMAHAGWRLCGRGEWKTIRDWLLERAIEHDTPSLLFEQVLEQLRRDKIVRPGLDRLIRAVAAARAAAVEEIHHRLAPQLQEQRCQLLDSLLRSDPARGVAPLVWLLAGATSESPESIKAELAKLAYLRELGADRLDLNAVPPERRRQLATVAHRSTAAALRDMDPRRHPILLAALAAAHTEIIDEVVAMFDQMLASTDRRARHLVAERQRDHVSANIDRLGLLDEILDVVLDASLDDDAAGAAVRGLGHDRLAAAVRQPDERTPGDGGHLALMEARYAHVRSFAPQVLAALSFSASVTPSELLDGVTLLQAMNAQHLRHVPPDAPLGFVPARWRPYLTASRAAGEENLVKHYWELCVLFALQAGLRSGEIWVQHSRRYTNPASYLIGPDTWPARRGDTLARSGMPSTYAERLDQLDTEISGYLDVLEPMLSAGDGPLRIDEHGQLHLTPLAAETVDPVVLAEGDQLLARLPTVPLTEILIEVDRETGFTSHLTHASGAEPRHGEVEHRRNLYAAILAQACNLGATRMSEL
ncbi:MAG TPA: DUF4158 domain-containing protein, partial [Streptosporangiaceae bacterium]|nr:DUF4158 domain-containing protein [Streptosporangiaceae bacterium]